MTAITLNLDPNIISFVQSEAKARKTTQKKIFEEAIMFIKNQKKKKQFINESKELWKNNSEELLHLSNSGLDDYNSNLKVVENG